MTAPVFTLLKNAAAVTALIGSNPVRAYEGGMAPQNVARPYLTWNVIAGMPENYLSGRPNMDMLRIQIDCWGGSADEAEQLMQAAQAALELNAHQVSFNGGGQDPETLTWRETADFVFWQPR